MLILAAEQWECGWDNAPHLQCHSCLGNALSLHIQRVAPGGLLLVQVGKSSCHTKRQLERGKEQEKYSVGIFGVVSGDSPSRTLTLFLSQQCCALSCSKSRAGARNSSGSPDTRGEAKNFQAGLIFLCISQPRVRVFLLS